MITKDNLKFIYEKILSEEIITSKELLNSNLNYHDINKLIEKGLLEHLERGKYGLKSREKLFNYGKYLLNEGKYKESIKILKKCLTDNSNNLEIYKYLLYLNIIIKDYEKAIKILEKINKIEKNTNKYNLYLYLLCNIYTCYPKKYNNKLINLKTKDLIIYDEEINSCSIYPHRNISQLVTYIKKLSTSSPLSEIDKQTLELLSNKFKEKETKFYNKLLNYAIEEEYQEIINLLEKREKKQNLNNNYTMILSLCRKIKSIEKTGIVPKTIKKNQLTTSHNIENNDFVMALQSYTKKLSYMDFDKSKDILNILLIKINKMIEKNKSEEKFNLIFKDMPRNKSIEDILEQLFKNNIDAAIELIKIYLNEINQEQYLYLVINLIKIDLCKRDELFIDTATCLTELSENLCIYDISTYLHNFYQSLSTVQNGVAKLYLDIISNYSKDEIGIINNLQNKFNQAMKENTEFINLEKKLLISTLNKMKENNEVIKILKPMTKNRRNILYEIIKSIPELTAFAIGDEPKTIVLRYLDPNLNIPDFSEIIQKSRTSYNKGEYQKTIELNHQLLKCRIFDPYYGNYAYIYVKLGLSYLNLSNINEAIKYLTIATELNKKDPKGKPTYDFTELLTNIKNNKFTKNIEIEDTIIFTTRFGDKINNNCGITQIEEIAYYLKEENLSLKEISKKLSLTEEQIQLLKLIFARDYYVEEMYTEGDKLLHAVEKSKNKTNKVNKFLSEVRNNKKFYKNQKHLQTRKLVL